MKFLNCRGQALVEFVIILPIFIFMMFIVIDLGKILNIESNLESRMDAIITAYETTKEKEDLTSKLELTKDNISLEITTEQEYKTFILQKKTNIITPGLNVILGNPLTITTKRVIYNE